MIRKREEKKKTRSLSLTCGCGIGIIVFFWNNVWYYCQLQKNIHVFDLFKGPIQVRSKFDQILAHWALRAYVLEVDPTQWRDLFIMLCKKVLFINRLNTLESVFHPYVFPYISNFCSWTPFVFFFLIQPFDFIFFICRLIPLSFSF